MGSWGNTEESDFFNRQLPLFGRAAACLAVDESAGCAGTRGLEYLIHVLSKLAKCLQVVRYQAIKLNVTPSSVVKVRHPVCCCGG